MKKKKADTAKPYAPLKAAKKKAVKRKSAIQRSQDTLIKGRLKFLEEESKRKAKEDVDDKAKHKANLKALGPAISSKRFGNTPVVEDEQCSDPTKTKSVGKEASVIPTNLGGLKLKTKQPPHIVVEALAGTGKTFTLIVGVAWAFGGNLWPEIQRQMAIRINEKRKLEGKEPIDIETFRVKPSDQQQKVWDSLKLSQGHVKTITYCAFNKSIVEEFGSQWGWMAKMLDTIGITLQFSTINRLGNLAVADTYGYLKVNGYNPETILGHVTGKDIWDLKKTKAGMIYVKAIKELVDVCKLTLTGWNEEDGFSAASITDEDLVELVNHFDIDTGSQRESIFQAAKDVLARSLNGPNIGSIDFNDQNWLPVVNDLTVNKVDLLMVDEAQDLPRCKQEFARMVGRRIVIVGDVNQAIYGFAGADVDSIPRMKELLQVEESFKLTKTYRCCKAIVRECNKIVEDFEAADENPEGAINFSTMDKYSEIAQDNDMVLCRVNAPLVSQALKFVKDGRKAIIRGREFGESLVKFVRKFETQDVGELIVQIQLWADKESALELKQRNPSDQKLISIEDKKECIRAFCEESENVDQVIRKIENVFAGKQCPKCKKSFDESTESCFKCQCALIKPDGVLFSSVHKAKGLEADRCFILRPKGASMPHPMAKSKWQIKQEWNCLYIAQSRGRSELVYVDP